MIPLRDRLNDLLSFRGVQGNSLIKLLLVLAGHVTIEVATAFPAKFEFTGGGDLKAAFARFVCFHLRH